MVNDLDILKKELQFHGIEVVDSQRCSFEYQGRKITAPISIKIKLIQNEIKKNYNVFKSLWEDLGELLAHSGSSAAFYPVIDRKTIDIFIFSLKDIFLLCTLLCSISSRFSEFAKEKLAIYSKILLSLNKDYKSFTQDIIESVPDYKISMDWILRRDSSLSYLIMLLHMVRKGVVASNNIQNIKIARGISGPWANLDLPMMERAFPWDGPYGIEEEMRGRDRDIRRQPRYNMAWETYNSSQNSPNEGYFWVWRELRNEPFLWDNRFSDSPYPSRSILSKY